MVTLLPFPTHVAAKDEIKCFQLKKNLNCLDNWKYHSIQGLKLHLLELTQELCYTQVKFFWINAMKKVNILSYSLHLNNKCKLAVLAMCFTIYLLNSTSKIVTCSSLFSDSIELRWSTVTKNADIEKYLQCSSLFSTTQDNLECTGKSICSLVVTWPRPSFAVTWPRFRRATTCPRLSSPQWHH